MLYYNAICHEHEKKNKTESQRESNQFGELGHQLGLYVVRVLYTARIRNVEI